MSKSELESKKPQFTVDEKGKPVVILDKVSYIALLVRSNVTAPSLWLPETEKGAKALARIRQIEANCIAQHGEFDWEKLPAELRDEYDALCASLDQLMDTGERIPLDELLASECWVTEMERIELKTPERRVLTEKRFERQGNEVCWARSE